MYRLYGLVCLLFVFIAAPSLVTAGVDISPYYSLKSTKSVTPGKKVDNEKVEQREEFGLKATVKMWRLLKFQFAIGQNNLSTSKASSEVVDEYDEIDFQTELAIDTSDPDAELNIKETQNLAKLSFVFDPSFSIFIARLKIGITARQRIIEKSGTDIESVKITEGPSYKPHSGLGFGVRLSRKIYWMAEYEFYHYKYAPDIEPFERELSVSFGISI